MAPDAPSSGEAPTTFADLIAPTSVEDFFADYWETTFLHASRATHGPERFAGYFSFDDVGRWTRSTREGVVFRLVPDGEGVQLDIQPAQALAPDGVLGTFRRGHAQVLKRVADWPPLQGLVDHLGAFFGAAVQVNACLTPAGARTYPTYTSNDEILVLQVEGEEVWRLHEFSVLQLDLAQKRHLEFPQEWHGRTGTPVLAEVRMRPGDVLYVPRGMPHRVIAPDTPGLHLRLYVTPMSWVDLFKVAAEHAAVHNQGLRRSLPHGFVESDEVGARMRATFGELMAAFQEVSFDGVLAATRRNRVAAQGFPSEGHFDAVMAAGALTSETEVERRPGVLCTVAQVVEADGTPKATIFFGDGRIGGPTRLLGAFGFVRDRRRFRVREVPGLDAAGQVVLVRRLIGEGLLRPVAAVSESVAEPVAALL